MYINMQKEMRTGYTCTSKRLWTSTRPQTFAGWGRVPGSKVSATDVCGIHSTVMQMEHYKKTQSCYYDDPCAANEMRITGTGKSHDLSTRATHRLQESPSKGIIISASGNHVTKAVTVVELLKRKLTGLQQSTQIKYVRVEDIWEPDIEGLDQLKVTRRIPAISVLLTQPETDAAPPSQRNKQSGSRSGRLQADSKQRSVKEQANSKQRSAEGAVTGRTSRVSSMTGKQTEECQDT